jgi:phage terminase small subunit
MSRPRIPTEVLSARGSFIANPSREEEREHEPVSDRPLGDPPARLSAEVQAIWQEVAEQLPHGVAKRSDRQLFEILCLLINKLRKAKIRVMELSALVSLCGKFAMSPSDRSKVAVNAEPSNALTKFLSTYKSSEPS